MKERPILFSGPLVRAILAGRKTQTRRVVKLDKGLFVCSRQRNYVTACEMKDGIGPWWHPHGGHPGEPLPANLIHAACPFGHPGDRLWVRETFAIATGNGQYPVYRADAIEDDSGERNGFWIGDRFYSYEGTRHWFPSIHMPRWASRITLEITNVRVERLQDISEADAKAEGVDRRSECGSAGFGVYAETAPSAYTFRWGFKNVWNDCFSERNSWGTNPWVWVIEFRRV